MTALIPSEPKLKKAMYKIRQKSSERAGKDSPPRKVLGLPTNISNFAINQKPKSPLGNLDEFFEKNMQEQEDMCARSNTKSVRPIMINSISSFQSEDRKSQRSNFDPKRNNTKNNKQFPKIRGKSNSKKFQYENQSISLRKAITYKSVTQKQKQMLENKLATEQKTKNGSKRQVVSPRKGLSNSLVPEFFSTKKVKKEQKIAQEQEENKRKDSEFFERYLNESGLKPKNHENPEKIYGKIGNIGRSPPVRSTSMRVKIGGALLVGDDCIPLQLKKSCYNSSSENSFVKEPIMESGMRGLVDEKSSSLGSSELSNADSCHKHVMKVFQPQALNTLQSVFSRGREDVKTTHDNIEEVEGYKFFKLLGSGSFAKVYKVRHKQSSKFYVFFYLIFCF